MADATAVTRGEVAADEVVVHQVVVSSGAQGQTATRTGLAGVVLDRSVRCDRVVVDNHTFVEGKWPLAGQTLQIRLADADAAVEYAGIAVDPVVADFQVVRPAVHVDAAAGVASRDTDTVNA